MKQTVATTNARIDQLVSNVEQLTSIVEKLATAQMATPAKKQAPAKDAARDWLSPCADYATAEQRAEYDKLANRARKQYKDACKFFGTEAVTCFIPVPKKQSLMPHTLNWKVRYSK